jgi:hypothetical protein
MNYEERKELVKYRLKRAKDTLKEVEVLIENEFLNTAVNRIYYACYYSLIALLLQEAFVLLTPISTTPPAGGCAQYDVSLSVPKANLWCNEEPRRMKSKTKS